VPRLGAEFGAETLPQEAGLEGLVSFTKGCFLGQEPVARLRTRGHTNRGLAGVVLGAGAGAPAAGDALLWEGKEVGAVTSACVSPALGRAVALCLLRHEAAAAGTRLDLRSGAGVLSCEVVPLPFVQGG
jgi:folate-binding protein YgfZ